MLAKQLPRTRFEPPLAQAPIRVVAVWHARNEGGPAHEWFRGVLRDSLR